MSWRGVQLGQSLCDQDKIIVDLFRKEPVRYIGSDTEFATNLETAADAENLVLILNRPMWCSEIIQLCRTHLDSGINKFYIGINRYVILGNDTNVSFVTSEQPGMDVINLLASVVNEQGFCITKSGTFDHDLGRYFNFVQPLTWIYGIKIANQRE